MPRRWALAVALAALCALGPQNVAAETIKIGMAKALANGLIEIAQGRGYFAAEGLNAEIVFLDSAQPLAVAVTSGDFDFALAGLGAGLYNLAGQGALKIIAAGAREAPGFNAQPYLASKRAYEAGWRSYRDFAGHSYALSQVGSSGHYNLALLAEKYGFDLQSIRLLPLQSLPNMLTALAGNQADFAVVPATLAYPFIQRGDAKVLGWVGDETPYQIVVAITAAKTAAERRGLVERFLRAYRKATHDYHDAFADADERRRDGPLAAEIVAVLSRFVGVPPDQVLRVIPWVDAEARLDVKDVRRQIDWYKSQGMVKPEVKGETFIDLRYVVPLPER